MKSATKEFGRLLRGALPFSVVNPNPQNLLENVLSYNSTDDAGAGATLIKADGDITVGKDLKLDNGGLEASGTVNVGGQLKTAMTIASPMLVEVSTGTYWSLGWWQAADNSWWLLGKMSEETSGFTRADAEFYVPLGMIADVPSA